MRKGIGQLTVTRRRPVSRTDCPVIYQGAGGIAAADGLPASSPWPNTPSASITTNTMTRSDRRPLCVPLVLRQSVEVG